MKHIQYNFNLQYIIINLAIKNIEGPLTFR